MRQKEYERDSNLQQQQNIKTNRLGRNMLDHFEFYSAIFGLSSFIYVENFIRKKKSIVDLS